MKIWFEFLGGNLFGGYDEGVDQPESIRHYAEMCRDAIQAAYPDAEVEVNYQIGVEGAGGGINVAGDQLDESTFEQMQNEESVMFNVEAITERVFNAGEWYVMAAANEEATDAQA